MANFKIDSLNLSKSKEIELNEDEKIDRILKDVALKNPNNAFVIFKKEEMMLFKANIDSKFILSEISKKIAEKWKKLKDEEKKNMK